MTNAVERREPIMPARMSQSTFIEQSREVAEVQARVMVAQQFPRDMALAIRSMRESCSQRALADRAFFRFPRGGKQVTGETIHLARELARVWTNVDYGIRELDRDDTGGMSEMVAYAWDMQANTRVSNAFLVPHARDREGGQRDKLTSLRDIYENNTNMGARRVRECIFGVLPPFLIEEAKALCLKTLAKDDSGKTLAQQVADAIASFSAIGVTGDQIEIKFGRPAARWTELDLANLRVIFNSLRRSETTIEDEFPPQRITVDEVTAGRKPRKATAKTTPKAAEPADQEQPADEAPTLAEIEALYAECEIDGDDRLTYASDTFLADIFDLSKLDAAQRTTLAAALRKYAAQQEPPAPEPTS